MNAFPPGRRAALARLAAIKPERYARSRNFLNGAVTRLSPYIRHGILDLAEVRDAVLERNRPRVEVDKLIQELAWRDYWRRAYGLLGERVWDDIEPYKTGVREYADDLPEDIRTGTTGNACIDASVRQLVDEGYVHNHARMWFASYVVHHRRVRWQAGAQFYLTHLLDGDPASNNLSWQWVASTFAVKPYIFDRKNVERYSGSVYCDTCPLASGGCPFGATYEQLDERLFPNARGASADGDGSIAPDLTAAADAPLRLLRGTTSAVVWIHPDALSDDGVARRTGRNAPAIAAGFEEMHARDRWSTKRREFVDRSLAEMRVDRNESGPAAEAIVAFARESAAERVITTASPDPLIRAIIAQVGAAMPIVALEPPRIVTLDRSTDLRRFSRYWKRGERSAFERTYEPSPTLFDDGALERQRSLQ